jgi:hypothetical protein
MPELARALLPALLALGGLALTGCAGHDRGPPLPLKTLTDRLPGTYDNSAQVAQELARGAANPHLTLTLRVAPAHALVISDNAFYVRESISADPRRVLSQRLWTLSEDPKHGRILQSLYVFKDPERWARAVEEPEMLVALTPDDLEPLQGCELAWTETDGLLRAVAAAGHCRPEALKEGMLLEQRMTIQGDELSLGEAEVGADGTVAAPALFDTDVDFYRFVRRASVAPSAAATAH